MSVYKSPLEIKRSQQEQPKNWQGYYAGFISRLLAFAIDLLIVSFAIVATTWFISVTTVTTLQVGGLFGLDTSRIPTVTGLINQLIGPAVAASLSAIFVFAYNIFFWIFVGKTPGKALMGLRLVTVDGRRVPPLRAALRYIGYFFSAVPLFAGFFWVLVDDRRQAWHDRLAGTLVIYTWDARPDERFLRQAIDDVGAGEDLPPDQP